MILINCKVCNSESIQTGNKPKVFCSKFCKDKHWRKVNSTKHKELSRKWSLQNPEKTKESNFKFRVNNKDYYNLKSNERRLYTKQQKPNWANDFYIEEIYNLAFLRTKSTGLKWHVDHIIPLKGKLVSGLHTENNLRIIPATVNLQKNNSFIEELI